ncbi:beta-ketoacyl synthase N-terminal-like domain-containing protein [Amycolatopsis sp. YIM 10]|uniref:beta-ketoacyl synthase N-terminal-like domain-containing protein n=1 Tax=Amycolatopsis sp. YIM 10 TaxID=2653857 RepID=UPI0012906042|nr:beta-ketoacyl synthase N-terminal-like domain-containing protein [Amycolatopsis sp. YIM 10]QFU91556.1 Phthiocerol/phenolphthiocerol synthesis polyketide synthase type I PpsA [Amycolatopsis sp. YIM 10]
MSQVTPVAIVGMSVLLPGAPDLATYWRNIIGGVDAISDVPDGRWEADDSGNEVYCRRGGFVSGAEIDVTKFGIMPNSVPGTEPDQLIALRVAADALADAGGRLPDRQRAGVILGRGGYLTPGLVRLDQRVRTARQLTRTLGELLPELGADQLARVRSAFTDALGPHSPESAIGLVPNLAASRVANRLDLRGPAYTVDAACASSLIAVDHAVRELASGRCDLMLAGGVHHCHDITLWSVFSQLKALSPSERIRPFHRDADGILIGEGTGVVVLKRLADAERDGDRIYAVIRGSGVASDGRTASLVNPDSGGQVTAVREAWRAAGLDPASIGLLEAHGTATPAGDGAELATLAEVFGPADGPRAVLGSVKSMIGHTMPAAGVAGLVKAALAVYHGVLPPTLHCDDPHPGLADTRFRTTGSPEEWAGHRLAGVNAFGFGGINAHVVLEQAGKAQPVVEVREPERTLRLAASTVDELARALEGEPEPVTGGTGPVRLAIADPTPKRLAAARKAVAKGKPWRGRNDIWFSPEPLLSGGGKIAFVFPGLEAEFEPRAEDVAAHFGLPWSAPDASVLGGHGAGVFQLGRLLDAALRRMNVIPDAVAGHSVGEWTAMACGGIYDQSAVDEFLGSFDPGELRVPGLAFAVIGTSADEVARALPPEVVLSHDNAPKQAMVCGPAGPVDELVRTMRAAGVISQVLPFQSGFHTPMLQPYLAPIRAAADRFELHPPEVPVWSATTAAEFPAAEDEVRELFVRHLLEPVRFRPMIEAMHAAGFRAFVQLGAGQVGSLIGDTLAGSPHLVIPANSAKRTGLAQLRRVALALWAEGGQPDLLESPRRKGVPIDLDTPPVRLGDTVRLDLGRPSELDSLANASPIAAELSALMRETANTAAELLAARKPPSLRVSVDEMPYLADHCFFRQRADWPDLEDRWPIVPATTVIGHLIEFAERAVPGTRAIGVHDVRLSRWLAAIPATEIPVEIKVTAPGRVAVELTGYARAEIELATGYPAPPALWRPGAERVPEMTAAQLYDENWMFHGPRYQGVSELTAIGPQHVRGVLTTPPAPGALLDNVGQLLGYWIIAHHPERDVVFPVHMRNIRFFGPHPAVGERLDCFIRITGLTESTLDADVQLSAGGRLWAEITGWRDRRFDSTPHTRSADRFPSRNTLSVPDGGGWVVLREQWPDLASRELIMRNHLGRAERADYDRVPPREKRQWLLRRIAIKDAVRWWLWNRGEGELFPAEIQVTGENTISGAHGRVLPPLTVGAACHGTTAVAMVDPGGTALDRIAAMAAEEGAGV